MPQVPKSKAKSSRKHSIRKKYRLKTSTIFYAASASNTAISINSAHPERAMKLIELMNTEKGKGHLYNLLVYGIEGEHYTKVNDNEIQPIGYTSPTSDSPLRSV